MAIKRAKYGFPQRLPQIRRATVSLDPTLGIHSGTGVAKAAPYSPSCNNLIHFEGAAAPRSGLSQFVGGALGIPEILAGDELFDKYGNSIPVVVSTRTIAFLSLGLNTAWSTLSRVGEAFSTTSTDYVDIAYTSESGQDNFAVVVNGVDPPKTFVVQGDALTWSDFTNSYSLLSRARTVAASDGRLVFGNTSDTDGPHTTRLAWSVRGAPKNYTIASGAGFVDLHEMRGQILKIVPDQEGFVILSNLEVWRARPRRDNFAFDFIPITRQLSCSFPDTVAVSPVGTIFLGSDFEVYAIAGVQLVPLGRPLGAAADDTISRVRAHVRDNIGDGDVAWGVYNRNDKRYELYLNGNKALYFDLETGSWWPQSFPVSLTKGFEITDPAAVSSNIRKWDEINSTWDNFVGRWDDAHIKRVPLESRQILAFSSNATGYRLRPDQHTDDATPFVCRWDSHSLRASNRNVNTLQGLWVEYNSASTGTISVAARAKDSAQTQPFSLASSFVSSGFISTHVTDRAPFARIEFQSPVRARLCAVVAELDVRGGIEGRP